MINKYIVYGEIAVIIIILLLWYYPSGNNGLSVINPTTSSSNICTDPNANICTITCTPRIPTANIPRDTTNGLPTDGTTCRNYATSQGYSASGWMIDIISLSSCQYYVTKNKCSAPSKVDIANNCCMWSC